jgi:two-component system, cell cycle sensor histidine kinase and response regulator CckA
MNNLPADKNRRVLVMDDNPAIHDDFRKILSPATASAVALTAKEMALFGESPGASSPTQFEVDSACQGQEGLLLVKKALEAGLPYALAFVDVRMPPGWDGVETTQRILEIDPDLQIVLCTAHADFSWEEMFRKLGHRDGLLILKKPFESIEALQLAHALTEKWWLRQQSRGKMAELECRVADRTRELQQSNHGLQAEIVERTRTENTLRESDEKFHQLADNITDAFWIRSPDLSEVYYISPAFERIWGRTTESLYANPQQWADFILPEDRPRVLAAFAALTGGASGLDLEYRIVRPGGEHRWVHVRSFQVRDGADKLIRHIGIVTDITERKRLQDQLIQSQKLEIVGRLAGGIAHEFNSPMTVIIGQSDLLLDELPPGNSWSTNAIEIRQAAERTAILTRQLLAYGRKQMLRPEILNLNSVLAGLESTLRQLMGPGVDVRLAPAAGLRPLKADAGQIEEVIMNLAMNADDAMPKGGKLIVETANVTLDREYVSRFPELKTGDYVLLAITDTGTGMSEEVKAHLFEPFFTTKAVGEGTGLGLSTCYGIVRQSGGHISVDSELARGTTFKIYLPQVEPQTEIPPQPLAPLELPHGTETILLVEGDPALREMAAALLKRLGYTVLAAANGNEALSLKRQHDSGPIDLLLTDIVMAGMSGKELADRVRALDPHARILFTSAYAENAIANQGVLNPGVAFLTKPFTPSTLAHKLREVLDHFSAPKPAEKAEEAEEEAEKIEDGR